MRLERCKCVQCAGELADGRHSFLPELLVALAAIGAFWAVVEWLAP